MRVYSAFHVNRCEYCQLAGDIREQYEALRERMQRVRQSNDEYDVKYYVEHLSEWNTLYSLHQRMTGVLDRMHDVANR